jgi:hypothetical protein
MTFHDEHFSRAGFTVRSRFALIQIRTFLLNTMLFFVPTIRLEIWHDTIYSIIWWGPQQARGIMRPDKWHTTLVRARPGLLGLAAIQTHLAAWNASLHFLLQSLLADIRSANGAVRSWITLPPWQGSWNFGVPDRMSWICEPLMLLSEGFFLQADKSVRIQERRPFHVSWH